MDITLKKKEGKIIGITININDLDKDEQDQSIRISRDKKNDNFRIVGLPEDCYVDKDILINDSSLEESDSSDEELFDDTE